MKLPAELKIERANFRQSRRQCPLHVGTGRRYRRGRGRCRKCGFRLPSFSLPLFNAELSWKYIPAIKRHMNRKTTLLRFFSQKKGLQ